jgi:hypothetical protein
VHLEISELASQPASQLFVGLAARAKNLLQFITLEIPVFLNS